MNERKYGSGGSRHVPAGLERVLAAEVSLPSRMRHLAVGLAGLCGAGLITVLWATEPETLPVRTQAAFGSLITVGLAWAAFAAWALSRRRPLFAQDRVVGACLALAATATTTAAGVALAAVRATPAAALTTGLTGALLTAVAGVALVRARGRRRELLRVRGELEGRREVL
ncbi:transmembrane transport protein [Streptomyces sp. NPDC057617]|uniref:transmembrane transport protein n=1 Tax=Streptomyces sp. NPDC057617 TaxID=3346184 RepID=UPI0036B1CA47